MSTRSDIIVKRKDGKFARVYCHNDGYPAYNGQCLQRFYATHAKAMRLIRLGNLSSLAPLPAPPKGVAHSFDTRAPGVTIAYRRDRKENNVSAKVFDTFADCREYLANSWSEYGYVFQDGAWHVFDSSDMGSPLELLSDVLAKIDPKLLSKYFRY
jgi:hypothetical protein